MSSYGQFLSVCLVFLLILGICLDASFHIILVRVLKSCKLAGFGRGGGGERCSSDVIIRKFSWSWKITAIARWSTSSQVMQVSVTT